MAMEGREEATRLAGLRNQLQSALVDALDEVRVNGGGAERHPGNLNVSFGYLDGAALLLEVCKSVSVSSGAACSSEEVEPSYVLDAMGVDRDWAKASIRFGLGRSTTEEHVEKTARATIDAVNALRAESPMWAAHQRGETIEW
jgi:cysteine desulfurase